jgi:conjugative relaxase-like TrwC/TraI family protein
LTARTTTLKGPEAGRYYVEGLPSYYLDSGEPPGRWHGNGAAALGLAGDVVDEQFLHVMAGEHPATGALLGGRYIERSVRGFDITCSAPKSVSLLFGLGDDRMRREALDAHDAAVTAVVDWIERHAHCRYRVNGEINVFDADGIVAATFRQHTSRALDPQLHTHVVIANRVPSPDGRWLALDARTIKHDQRTLSALYHAVLRSELTARLGVTWREPVNGIAEISGVPEELLAAFSTRTDEVDRRLERKLERFEATFGREATPRERWRLERDAVTDSRPAKTSVDAGQLRTEWIDRARGLGLEVDVLERATDVGEPRRELTDDAVRQVVERATASLTQKQSTWRPAELVRELAAALPTDIVIPAREVGPWLDDLAEKVIAWRCVDLSRPVGHGAVLRRDGRPLTESALDRVLTLPEILLEEERVIDLAARWVNEESDTRLDVAPLSATMELTAEQNAAASAVAGHRRLVLVVGPAGTGKTNALEPAVRQLQSEGRRVFGVAPSATAGDVLATDAGIDADTIDKLLIEHTLDRPPHPKYDLPAGSTVMVDEAAMVSTPKLAQLFDLAERHQWRLALVGDPLQFSAVGRGGLFAHLVDTLGAVELGRVHRFNEHWERDASLRLRKGDLTVVDLYDQHGRLHDGTAIRMRYRIIRAWWDATARGETASMMAPTNELVVELNQLAQQRRLDAGQLDARRSLAAGAYRLHVGDVIATRHNDRTLRTDRNQMVKNRDRWTITAIHDDGRLTITGRTGGVTLPQEYVREHVELAYAETSHSNQGRTVDRSFLLLDGATNAAGIYVPMTRGRLTNEAFVITHGGQTASDVITESLTRTWIDRPAVERRAELAAPLERPPERDRPLPDHVVRQLLERAHEIERAQRRAHWDVDQARTDLDNINHRRARLQHTIDDYETRIAQSRQVLAEHDRPLHRRRHRHEIDGAQAQLRWMPGALEQARAELADVTAAEGQAVQRLSGASARVAAARRVAGEHFAIAGRLASDRRARARDAVDDPAIIERLGERPPLATAADRWDEAAGRLAQHRAAFGEGVAAHPRFSLDNTARSESERAAVAANAALDQALGRSGGVDRSLGLSL